MVEQLAINKEGVSNYLNLIVVNQQVEVQLFN